jgi:DNA-binding Lrp family transcriptional regulator
MKRSLDETDIRIVTVLQKNARLSNKELAAQVGLAPSTCLERVRRLTDAGVLRGFHADVSHAALGIHIEAMISIRLATHAKSEIAQFRKRITALDEVCALYHVTGANDYLVYVAVRDTDHLRSLVVSGITAIPDVAHVETALIFESVRKPVLPVYVED